MDRACLFFAMTEHILLKYFESPSQRDEQRD